MKEETGHYMKEQTNQNIWKWGKRITLGVIVTGVVGVGGVKAYEFITDKVEDVSDHYTHSKVEEVKKHAEAWHDKPISYDLVFRYLKNGAWETIINECVEKEVTPEILLKLQTDEGLTAYLASDLVGYDDYYDEDLKGWTFNGKEYMQWHLKDFSLDDMVRCKNQRMTLEDTVEQRNKGPESIDDIIAAHSYESSGVPPETRARYLKFNVEDDHIKQVSEKLGDELFFDVVWGDEKRAKRVVKLVVDGKLDEQIYNSWGERYHKDVILFALENDKDKAYIDSWRDAGVWEPSSIKECEELKMSREEAKAWDEAGVKPHYMVDFRREGITPEEYLKGKEIWEKHSYKSFTPWEFLELLQEHRIAKEFYETIDK